MKDINSFLYSLFCEGVSTNTLAQVKTEADGKKSVVGTNPTEAATIDFGLSLGADFKGIRSGCQQV